METEGIQRERPSASVARSRTRVRSSNRRGTADEAKPSGESQAWLRVMRERGLLVGSRRLRARRKKEWGRVETSEPNQIWHSDITKIWAGPTVRWTYLGCVIGCWMREIVG
jgi:hypothetical protein